MQLTLRQVHVDCDAFFASVEELERPELKNVPMAVGGGVLTTCNYKAREFGVRSGMAGHIAKKICPQLVFIPINMSKYSTKAEEVRSVLVNYDPRYESGSCDEAFLNITKYLEDHPEYTPDSLVEQIRAEVAETTKITISAGIGPNAKIAKIASNQNKPNGQFRIQNTRTAVQSFMSTLPVRKINGIGRVFERSLHAISIKTCGDIYAHRALLRPLFGTKAFHFLLHCHLGIGRTTISPADETERKSIGTESTFRDLSGPTHLRHKLRSTAKDLAKDLDSADATGRILVLKVKLHTYRVYTRQRNLARPLGPRTGEDEIYALALPLLEALESEFPRLRIRLMGLRVTGLVGPRREKVDVEKFFGKSAAGRKRKVDGDGWEVWDESAWPEEEFVRAQEEERELELRLTQELEEELAEREGLGREVQGRVDADGWEVWPEQEGNASPAPQSPSPPPPKPQTWQCPICSSNQPADDTLFNQHVDFCLSKAAIRSAVHETTVTPPPPPPPPPPQPPKKKRVGAGKW